VLKEIDLLTGAEKPGFTSGETVTWKAEERSIKKLREGII